MMTALWLMMVIWSGVVHAGSGHGIAGSFKTPGASHGFVFMEFFDDRHRNLVVVSSHEHQESWVNPLIARCRKKTVLSLHELNALHAALPKVDEQENSVVIVMEKGVLLSSGLGSRLSVRALEFNPQRSFTSLSSGSQHFSRRAKHKISSNDQYDEIHTQQSHTINSGHYTFIIVVFGNIPGQFSDVMAKNIIHEWSLSGYSLLSLTKKERNNIDDFIGQEVSLSYLTLSNFIQNNSSTMRDISPDFFMGYAVVNNNAIVNKNDC